MGTPHRLVSTCVPLLRQSNRIQRRQEFDAPRLANSRAACTLSMRRTFPPPTWHRIELEFWGHTSTAACVRMRTAGCLSHWDGALLSVTPRSGVSRCPHAEQTLGATRASRLLNPGSEGCHREPGPWRHRLRREDTRRPSSGRERTTAAETKRPARAAGSACRHVVLQGGYWGSKNVAGCCRWRQWRPLPGVLPPPARSWLRGRADISKNQGSFLVITRIE